MFMETFANWIIGLPDPLKVFIAAAVLYLVRLVLAGRVPEETLTEIAVAVSTALVTVIELGLGLIPPEFEAVATAVLNLIAVLLGTIFVVRTYLIAREHARVRDITF